MSFVTQQLMDMKAVVDMIGSTHGPAPKVVTSLPSIEAKQQKKGEKDKAMRRKIKQSSRPHSKKNEARKQNKPVGKSRTKKSVANNTSRKTAAAKHKVQQPEYDPAPKLTISMPVFEDKQQRQQQRLLNKVSSHISRSSQDAAGREPSNYNSVDEVIDEANAFLQCAYEAQALGLLKKAHIYLILAHGRLVGLGRFAEYGHPFGQIDGLECDLELENTTNSEDGLLDTFQMHHNEAKSMKTPSHGTPLLPKPKITPSPTNTNQLQSTTQETNNLSGTLAQWSQEVLYKQKGIGNAYAAHKQRKAHRNTIRIQKNRAASFDSKEASDSSLTSEKNDVVKTEKATQQKPTCKESNESVHANLGTLSASVMTADFAPLDAKVLIGESSSTWA